MFVLLFVSRLTIVVFAIYIRSDGMSLGVSIMTLILQADYEVILLHPERI